MCGLMTAQCGFCMMHEWKEGKSWMKDFHHRVRYMSYHVVSYQAGMGRVGDVIVVSLFTGVWLVAVHYHHKLSVHQKRKANHHDAFK